MACVLWSDVDGDLAGGNTGEFLLPAKVLLAGEGGLVEGVDRVGENTGAFDPKGLIDSSGGLDSKILTGDDLVIRGVGSVCEETAGLEAKDLGTTADLLEVELIVGKIGCLDADGLTVEDEFVKEIDRGGIKGLEPKRLTADKGEVDLVGEAGVIEGNTRDLDAVFSVGKGGVLKLAKRTDFLTFTSAVAPGPLIFEEDLSGSIFGIDWASEETPDDFLTHAFFSSLNDRSSFFPSIFTRPGLKRNLTQKLRVSFSPAKQTNQYPCKLIISQLLICRIGLLYLLNLKLSSQSMSPVFIAWP